MSGAYEVEKFTLLRDIRDDIRLIRDEITKQANSKLAAQEIRAPHLPTYSKLIQRNDVLSGKLNTIYRICHDAKPDGTVDSDHDRILQIVSVASEASKPKEG